MNPKNLPPKLMLTLLSLTSLSAHAAEVLIKVGSRTFKADIPGDQATLENRSGPELIDLLRSAEVTEMTVKTGSDNATQSTWTEPREMKVAPDGVPGATAWCEPPSMPGATAWCEPPNRNDAP